jgi:hypothetical protein
MSTTNQLVFYDGSVQGCERALYALPGKKQRRSGPQRTALSVDRPHAGSAGRVGRRERTRRSRW